MKRRRRPVEESALQHLRQRDLGEPSLTPPCEPALVQVVQPRRELFVLLGSVANATPTDRCKGADVTERIGLAAGASGHVP